MYIIAIISILGIVVKFVQGIINDKYGFEATLIASSILPIIGMILLASGYCSIEIMIIFATLMGLGGIGSSLPYLLTAAIYGKENNTKGSSIVNNFIVGGQVVSAVGLFAPLANSFYVM
jgi:MFS family permease